MLRIIIFPFLLLALSCIGQSSTHTNFYFPPKSFVTERTYYFVNQNDTAEVMVWKMKADFSGGDTTLHTSIFNNNGFSESMVERIENENSTMLSYILYKGTSSSICTIIDSSIYKTNQDATESIQWKVTFADFNPPALMSMEKRRKILSSREDSVTFFDRITVAVVGTADKYEYFLESTYKAGIGLVSCKLNVPNRPVKNFQLMEIE